jgi:hypothetical protein
MQGDNGEAGIGPNYHGRLTRDGVNHRILRKHGKALGRPLLIVILIVIVISPFRWVKEDYDEDYDYD